jgi:hypothetical protein
MNLQEFIQETLIQIAQASQNVSNQMQQKGLGEGVRDNLNINVSFDIAVSASVEKNKNAKVGLTVLNAVVLGGKKGEVITSENVSRIKLELPLKVSGAKTPISVVV